MDNTNQERRSESRKVWNRTTQLGILPLMLKKQGSNWSKRRGSVKRNFYSCSPIDIGMRTMNLQGRTDPAHTRLAR